MRPDPMVPSDCDLRGMPFMPLEHGRLLDSDLYALSNGDEFKAALTLWCKSWTQLPAGSLPQDERVLAHLSSAKNWKRVREMALRGWVLCTDDRYYHPVVASNVLEAWERRGEFREALDAKESRQQRWREKIKRLSGLLRNAGITVPPNPSLKELTRLCETHVDGFVDASPSTPGDAVDAPETALTVDSDSRQKEERENAGASVTPTPAGLAAKAMKQAGLVEVNPGHPTLLALLQAGMTAEELAAAATEAVHRGKGFAYALVVAESQRREAAKVLPLPAKRAEAKPWEGAR